MNEVENNYQDTDLGNVSLNPKDEYDPTVAYEFLDTVSYQGGSYVCRAPYKTTITGTAPEPGHNTEFWQMLTLPGDLTSEYVAMHDDVVNKAAQVEISRAAVEQAQQEVEAAQADVQQLHEDTVQAAQEAENSRDSAAGYAQAAEASRKAATESEQNINAQMAGLGEKVSESVTQAQEEIATARQQAIDAITTQETKSTAEVKRVGDATLESAGQALRDINTAGQQAVQAVTDQQNTSIQAVKDETNSYIEEKRQEISAKTDEVTQAVNQAGEEQLQDIANSLDSTLSGSGKAADSKAVGDAIALIEENKANKSALATTDRKLDALWKLNQGITYEFQTDSTEAYQKEIPTGAKMASVKQIGGKTIVWNQLIDETYGKSVTRGNVTITNNKDGSYTVFTNGAATETVEARVYFLKLNRGAGKYYLKGSPSNGEEIGYSLCGTYVWKPEYGKADYGNGVIIDDNVSLNYSDIVRIKVNEGTIISTPIVFKPQLFNLTKMFGVGNEPSTVEEFKAMFPEEYYPYDEGELTSAFVNEVVKQGKNLINIPDGQTTSQKYYDVEIPRDVQITVSSKIARSNGGLSRIRLDYKIDEEWKYCAGNSVVSGLSYVTAVVPREANNTRIAFQFLDNISGTLAYKDTQIELGLQPTAYMPYKELALNTIPQTIFDLPGYGWSAGAVCNYVDWENKEYIQRVGCFSIDSESKVGKNIPDMDSWIYFIRVPNGTIEKNNVLSNVFFTDDTETLLSQTKAGACAITADYGGAIYVNLYGCINQNNAETAKQWLIEKGVKFFYPIQEPIVTDITDVIPEGFLEAIEVEAGGSLTFQNSNDGYKVPVPNTVEYAVKLSEVAE